MSIGVSEPDVTSLLQRLERGDEGVQTELMPIVYDELRSIASRHMSREREGHTLDATGLVNEAWLRLVDQTRVQWGGRTHFFAVAATAMRRVLVDHARSRQRLKRGGKTPHAPLDEAIDGFGFAEQPDLVALDEALVRLARQYPDHARLVELRYFAGMTMGDAAKLLDVSERTGERWWRFAKAWLFTDLADEGESS